MRGEEMEAGMKREGEDGGKGQGNRRFCAAMSCQSNRNPFQALYCPPELIKVTSHLGPDDIVMRIA